MMLKWHLERDWDQDLHRPGPAMAGHQTHPGPVSSEGAQGYHQPAGDRGIWGTGGPRDWGIWGGWGRSGPEDE